MRSRALLIAILTCLVVPAPAKSETPGALSPNAAASLEAIAESVSEISESISTIADSAENMERSDNEVTGASASQDEAIEGLVVTETEKEITIDLSSDILFDFNKSSIRSDASRALTAAERILSKYPNTAINLEGHTDSVGSDQYNRDLSMKRALSVREWFIENSDIPARRFKFFGLGESRPVSPNANPDGSDNPDGRQKNRRVTIVVKK